MIADLEGAAFRDWITDRLDPLDLTSPSAHAERSDADLDPAYPVPPGPDLKPAAVLIGLVERPEGHSVIFTRRADTLRSHTGQIALPGGRCEPGEAPWAAALRETEEEIGLDPTLITLAGLSTPYRTGTGYFITPVVGFVTPPFTLSPNPQEVADIFESPFGFLMDPANHEPQEGRTPSGDLRRFYAITWADRRIWGVTAGILKALRDRLWGPLP